MKGFSSTKLIFLQPSSISKQGGNGITTSISILVSHHHRVWLIALLAFFTFVSLVTLLNTTTARGPNGLLRCVVCQLGPFSPAAASASRLRLARPLRGVLQLHGEDGGRRPPGGRGRAPAAGAVPPARVRVGARDAAVERAQPRRPHRVRGRERVLRRPRGGAQPGAGSLRRGLHHQGSGDARPPGRRASAAPRGLPAGAEPALLRLPPRHQRPPQPALRRRLGCHPRRRAEGIFGDGARADVGHLHGRRHGQVRRAGARGRARPRLRSKGGEAVQRGVPLPGEPCGRHPQPRPLPHQRRPRR
ncbi:plant-specific domain TIGR01627 family protein [Musa troglodytarum]|uniref:Plant-specific domain TIGR01627 family protein n=1 Tax=Musa troglodytarum TaxID=320322 RepID=A0A9E7KPS6_9LILI|nr:plant-specific domain TIGR01627 family protein [Musa troglodytarum]